MLDLLFDRYSNLSPESPYWIDSDDESREGNYCFRCVKQIDAGRDKYIGTGTAPEADGCVHCDKCGKLLNYTLTDSGADAELDHFRSVRFRRDRLLDRETAFHLARLIAAKSSDPEVISIAARAIRCMLKVPDLTSQ